MTNHVLFIHGVNTRQKRDQIGYSAELFKRIKFQAEVTQIELYWGDINKGEERNLCNMWEGSSSWNELLFQKIRQNQLLQFIGDAALYLSRADGKKIVSTLYQQIVIGLKDIPESDGLHIVAHSWGTVILFDILFAARWDGDDEVEAIRKNIYGVTSNASDDKSKKKGYKISSIHTMGSPLSIYQLMSINTSNNTHDISIRLSDFVKTTHNNKKKPLVWNNYIHPCDPVGYPLSKVLPNILNIKNGIEINVLDFVLPKNGILDFIMTMVNVICPKLALVLYGGKAHGNYWESDFVATKIANDLCKENNAFSCKEWRDNE